MRVLLVEDDTSTRRFLRVIFKKLGYETRECENAEIAWEAYQKQAYDIALLDWMLPGMSGVDLCRRIRASPDGENTYILMSTSQDQLSDIEVALKAGADDYLIKPVDIKQMKIRLFIAEQRIKVIKDQSQLKTAIQNKLKAVETKKIRVGEAASPIISIWDGVLLLPHSGPINAKKISITRKKILTAVTNNRARQIIIDITNVPFLDTDTARGLIKTINAVKMVGAQAIVVGISGPVAETMVEVVVDPGAIKTEPTLAEGLEAALLKMKYKIVKT